MAVMWLMKCKKCGQVFMSQWVDQHAKPDNCRSCGSTDIEAEQREVKTELVNTNVKVGV
jgi:predicted Zn-ribbon and HTH transcriptional regulator